MSVWNCEISMCLLAVAKNTEEVDEEVDEIKVKCEATHQRQLHSRFIHLCTVHEEHVLNLLCVINRKSRENQDAGVSANPHERSALEEEVYHRSNEQPDERHHKEAPKAT